MNEIDEHHISLDPHIAPLVYQLRQAGFNTLSSCQGGEGHLFPQAWIRLTPIQTDNGFFPHQTWDKAKTDVYRQFDELIEYSHRLPPCNCVLTINYHNKLLKGINGPETPGIEALFDLEFWSKAEEFPLR